MEKIKQLTLKSIFFIIAIFIFGGIIGSVCFLISNPKEAFIPYMISYGKFFMNFLILSSVMGVISFGFIYLITNLYKKLFS